jgi:hypothetical protein
MAFGSAHPEPFVVLVLDAHVVSWWDRIRARLLSVQLDRRLASGRSPDSSAPLALRARELLSPRTREDIASAFDRLAAPWTEPDTPRHLPMPARSQNHASREMAALAQRMRSGPVAVSGLASASLLLTDGTGPLYHPLHADSLELAARALLDSLDPGV